jgi:(p)ppGpp synthase/HD superfamily hydrolase
VKTSKAHFRMFDKQVSKWLVVFNLSSQWKVFVTHVELIGRSMAETECDYPGKVATIFLNKVWEDTEVTERELDETAFHEVLEIVLDKLDSMAKISCQRDKVDEARHDIIQMLTCTIFDPLYKKEL